MITIYTNSKTCRPCQILKDKLKDENLLDKVVFVDFFDNKEIFKEKKIKAVPTIEIDNVLFPYTPLTIQLIKDS